MDETTPYVGIALRDEPTWPDQPGPYLFLLEFTGPLELKLLEGWIERNRPADVDPGDVQIAYLPQNRRRRKRSIDPRIDAFLAGADDPLVVPLRALWLAREKGGKRRVGLRDLVTLGDPRDPDPIRQYVIWQIDPDRARIVMGDTARASEARRMWKDPSSAAQADGRSFADFVSMAAWLSMEGAERELRGSRYKVPKFPQETMIERQSFSKGVATLAREAGEPYQSMAATCRRYVKEIAATHSPYVIDLVTGGFHWLLTKAYVGISYDEEELAALYSMSQQFPLAFLPSHRSNFDHLALQYVLYENGLPPNHTAGGDNMNFFPVGPFIRRSGVFFIRREFRNNEPYKFVLRQYLDYLLERRFPLEWFIEGGRSRSGKMRPPRFGMLAYTVESYQRGSAEDVIFIPVSIAYDQIQDMSSYTAEQTGGPKDRESIGWLLKAIRGVHRRYGRVHVRFGAPISLRTYFAENQVEQLEGLDDKRDPTIPKLAFEIAVRINEATPITPISLVALVLLAEEERSLSLDEVMLRLDPYLDLIARRDLPMTEKIDPTSRDLVKLALEELRSHGVVTRFEGATETVYRVGPEQHLAAAYYRNTIIHFFLQTAITEVALVAAEVRGGDLPHVVIEEALELRDLLKFEFFFSSREDFDREIRFELADHDPAWRAHLEAGDARGVLAHFDPFHSPAVLRPFIEAYQVVADLIEQQAYQSTIDQDQLRKDAMRLGKQYLLQGRIQTAESVTNVLFDSAIRLADNRKLFDVGPDMVERRMAFAVEIRRIVEYLDALAAITVGRTAGIFN